MSKQQILRSMATLALLVLLAACGSGADALLGEWSQMSGSRPQSNITFNADGTGSFHPHGGMNYTIEAWSLRADYIELELAGTRVIAQIHIGETMKLSRANEFEELNGIYSKQ